MRRFSQKNSLVTLSEINITPLLDLAFVLLIIFVITTPLLEKGLDLKLPKLSGQADPKLDQRDIRTVEISSKGSYMLSKRMMPLNQILTQLAQDIKYNPNLVVYIRADADSASKYVAALIDGCQKSGITRYSWRTDPPEHR